MQMVIFWIALCSLALCTVGLPSPVRENVPKDVSTLSATATTPNTSTENVLDCFRSATAWRHGKICFSVIIPIGSVILITIIIVVCCCCWYHYKKHKRQGGYVELARGQGSQGQASPSSSLQPRTYSTTFTSNGSKKEFEPTAKGVDHDCDRDSGHRSFQDEAEDLFKGDNAQLPAAEPHNDVHKAIQAVKKVVGKFMSPKGSAKSGDGRQEDKEIEDDETTPLLGDEREPGLQPLSNSDSRPAELARTVDSETQKRISEEDIERENSGKAVNYYLAKTGCYSVECPLPDMGSRMQKYWYKVVPYSDQERRQDLVLTIAAIPANCKLLPQHKKLNKISMTFFHKKIPSTDDNVSSVLRVKKKVTKRMEELNNLLRVLKHPFLQPVEWVYYAYDRKQVMIVQQSYRWGSLKDMIYKTKPNKDWEEKYPVHNKPKWYGKRPGLDRKDIALYGRQILEAMMFLYSKGFPVLGHVQSGNIFVQDGVCRLGGYENTLLGYRSRLYRMCEDHLQHMDVIMFGHVIFEMSCGCELMSLHPSDEDYSCIRDKRVKEVLQFIFSYSNVDGFKLAIRKILEHSFFGEVWVPQVAHYNPEQVVITSDMDRHVLDKVKKA